MKPSTQVNTDKVIVFNDGSEKWITENQANLIMVESTKPDAVGMALDGGYYRFSSIKKILSAAEFYQQYPDKIPASEYNEFEDKYGEEGSQQWRNPTENAARLMMQGFVDYKKSNGATQEEVEKQFAAFIGREVATKHKKLFTINLEQLYES